MNEGSETMARNTVPGTVWEREDFENGAFGMIEPMLDAAGGFTLSQVCALTGAESTTIQNWVKRGWVAKPKDKKYFQRQLSRILIINALRDALQLERIVKLLAYLNGSVEDQRDDIIPESRLFDYLCAVTCRMKRLGEWNEETLCRCVQEVTSDYGGTPEQKERLIRGLTVMAGAYAAAQLRKECDELYCRLAEDFPPDF